MRLKVILIGLVRVVLTVLGSETDTTLDIMVLIVLVTVFKRVGFTMFVMLV